MIGVAAPTRLSFFERISPAVVLFFLAPLFGEYLLGNLKFTDLLFVPFIAPLYGGGAVLIREIARRTGGSYAAILTLGIAYSLIEEGLVDQLIFNPDYFEGQREMMQTPIPLLGVDAGLTLVIIVMHTIWSTCIPIILVEGIFAKRRATPWLGDIGLAVVGAIFVLGSIWLGFVIYQEYLFLASTPQFIVTGAVIVVLIMAAVAIKQRARTPAKKVAPNPWVAGGVAFAASTLYFQSDTLPGWWSFGAAVLVIAAFFALLVRWSRRRGWSETHKLALAGGGILTYGWVGAFMTPETGPKALIDHIGTGLFIAGAIALLVLALGNQRAQASAPA